MLDFNTNDLAVRTVIAEHDREARRLASRRAAPRGWRAALASRLARIALKLDRETTGCTVGGEFRTAGR